MSDDVESGQLAPLPTTLFLETTVQAARITLPMPLRQELDEWLARYRLVSSTYVLGELKETFLQTAVTFHRLLTDSVNTHVAFYRAEVYKERLHKRAMRIIHHISQDGSLEKSRLLRRLERMIEWQLAEQFARGLQELINKTGCARAGAQPVRGDRGYVLSTSCRQSPKPKCMNEQFVLESREELSRVLERLQAEDREQVRLIRALQLILADKRLPHGNLCRSIGDVVVALEVPEGALLATTNTKHYQPISEILGGPQVVGPVPR